MLGFREWTNGARSNVQPKVGVKLTIVLCLQIMVIQREHESNALHSRIDDETSGTRAIVRESGSTP